MRWKSIMWTGQAKRCGWSQSTTGERTYPQMRAQIHQSEGKFPVPKECPISHIWVPSNDPQQSNGQSGGFLRGDSCLQLPSTSHQHLKLNGPNLTVLNSTSLLFPLTLLLACSTINNQGPYIPNILYPITRTRQCPPHRSPGSICLHVPLNSNSLQSS